jgi:hypothetical protein
MKTKRITIIILTLILIFSLVFLSACLSIMNAAEIKGSIDLFRYSIEADCDGYFVNKETDASEEVHMKINGYLSENLNNFSGSLVAEGFGTKSFTAQK